MLFLRLMGVNPRIIPRLDLRLEFLPQPFVACRDAELLRQNIRIAQGLLDINTKGREWILICDETCFFPTLDLISGLRDSLGYVGGYYVPGEKDLSFITTSNKKSLSEADFDNLSRLSQHYVACRNFQVFNKVPFFALHIPPPIFE